MPKDDSREQLRKKYYDEAVKKHKESEQKRLNDIFSILGDVDTEDSPLNFLKYEFTTLEAVRSSAESGDRKAMLAFLDITARTLRAFETQPQKVRLALADGLEKMRINLQEAPSFLPIGKGKSSENKIRAQSNKAYWTALSVEGLRFSDGCSLEEARARVSEEKRLTESLVEKRWKLQHKAAKKTLEILNSVLKQPRKKVISKPRRKR